MMTMQGFFAPQISTFHYGIVTNSYVSPHTVVLVKWPIMIAEDSVLTKTRQYFKTYKPAAMECGDKWCLT